MNPATATIASDGCAVAQRIPIVFFLLLSIGGGLGTVISQAQTPYVANVGTNTVSVVDTTTNNVVATIPVGIMPVALAITPDGTRAYVAGGCSTVSLIDTASNNVSANINVVGLAVGIWSIAITPDGTHT